MGTLDDKEEKEWRKQGMYKRSGVLVPMLLQLLGCSDPLSRLRIIGAGRFGEQPPLTFLKSKQSQKLITLPNKMKKK